MINIKKYYNNKGSTMILLVMAIAIISLLGTSILGVTMMNLKIKKANTEIKQSFYLSESGLDNSYAKAYALVQKAVEGGNEKAKDFIDVFKMENIDTLKADSDYIPYLNRTVETLADGTTVDVYSFKEEEIKNKAALTFKEYFKKYIITKDYDNPHVGIVEALEGTSGGLTVTINNSLTCYFNGDELELDIDSLYVNPKNIHKTTSVKLVIKVPEYNEPYTVSTKIIPVNPFWTKILAAKNVDINSNTKVDGNVYISNNLNVDGANINPEFIGKLAVKGNINLEGANSRTYVKDTYSNNILLLGNGAKLEATCTNLKGFIDSGSGIIDLGSGIFVKDDLEINKPNQEVIIKNGSYYGFSEGSSNPDPDHSSGININTYDTSNIKIEIEGDVYLHGTSYVNLLNLVTNKKYQTGESVSIKGNYRAYMEPLTDTSITPELFTKAKFSDYGYLSFVDTDDNDVPLSAIQKSSYLGYYNQEYSGLGLNLSDKIKLATKPGTDVRSLGSTINNGVLIETAYDISDIDKVFNPAVDRYNLEIQKLGDENAILSLPIESDGLEFATQVNFNGFSAITDINDGTKLVYINNDPNVTYYLTSGNYNGLIVTSGNVEVTGNVNFKGSIISGKDIIINDSIPKTFTYDKNTVASIIADDFYRTIFKSDTTANTIAVTKFTTDELGGDDVVNVDFSKLLKFNDWQIK